MTGESLSALFSVGDRRQAAVISPDDGQAVSFGALEELVDRLAGELASLGVGRADRVALVLPGGVEFLALLVATTITGATAAPLNPAYTKDEFAFYLEDLDPRLLLVPQGDLRPAREAVPAGTQIVDVGLAPRDEAPQLASNGRPMTTRAEFEPGGPDDVALLLHTSGTTSRPKQVPLLQRNLVASARAIAAHYELTPDDVSYVAMPLFHVHGLVASVLAALVSGGAVVAPRRFAPQRFWAQARGQRITWFSAGPTLHQMILERRDADGPPSTLRFVRSCSSALSPKLMQAAEDAFGVPMLEAYGMTEASHQMTSNPLPPAARLPSSVGVSAGAEIRVVDAAGADVPDRRAGEVAICSPGVTPGYLNNPQANAEAFFDGWFRTGDRGRLEDGYLWLEGRIKELILRGGENISPYEIEEALLGHPAVSDAVCFGIADERYGEEVAAAVVLGGAADEAELRRHCRERLAQFKVPKTIKIVERIPRTATGKLQRRRVAALLEEAER